MLRLLELQVASSLWLDNWYDVDQLQSWKLQPNVVIWSVHEAKS